MIGRLMDKLRRVPSQAALASDGNPLAWHLDVVPALARVFRPALYVELGVQRAELFNRVFPYAGQLIGVDCDPRAAEHITKAPNVRFFCTTTDRFAEEVATDEGLIIDMLFIDADHSRAAVVNDFRTYFPFVRPHGLILLHDTHPGDLGLIDPEWCGDAYRAIEEIQRQDEGFEMMTIPVSPGLTLCRKRKAQLSWME